MVLFPVYRPGHTNFSMRAGGNSIFHYESYTWLVHILLKRAYLQTDCLTIYRILFYYMGLIPENVHPQAGNDTALSC